MHSIRRVVARAAFVPHYLLDLVRGAYDRTYLKLRLKHCGDRLQTQRPFVIIGPRQIEIGDDVSFAAFLHIWGFGGVTIGNRVTIASHVAITSSTHDPRAEVMHNSSINKMVIIEDDVWIGTHSVILPGIHIGHGSVIAAGAVVTKDVPPLSVVGGVPARILRMRQTPSEPAMTSILWTDPGKAGAKNP
jgi:acetyltransferase-like isoleucine patch superfamily enzyme